MVRVSGGGPRPRGLAHSPPRVHSILERQVRAESLLRIANTPRTPRMCTAPVELCICQLASPQAGMAVPFPARFLPTAGERQSQAQGVHSQAVPGVQSRPQPEKSCQRGAGHFLSLPSGQGTPGQKGR